MVTVADEKKEDKVQPKRILVVDDEEHITLMLQESLEQLLECEVRTATNGEQALRLCEVQTFDLLLTDYKMPGMDGLTLAKYIRHLFPHIGVVMLSAHWSEGLETQTAKAGIRWFLKKPAKLVEIHKVILEALSNKAPESPLNPHS